MNSDIYTEQIIRIELLINNLICKKLNNGLVITETDIKNIVELIKDIRYPKHK